MTAVLERLLVAIDGSAGGAGALSFALALARQFGSEVLLCSAVDRAGAIANCSPFDGGAASLPLVQALNDAAESILSEAARSAAQAGVIAATLVLEGRPAQALVDCAHEHGAAAIVMGTAGTRGVERFFLGSTADGVLRGAEVPVFVVPPDATGAAFSCERIVVAVDDSDPSDAAAGFALALAEAAGSRLLFCGVAETNDVVAKARDYGYDPMPYVRELRATVSALLATRVEGARTAGVAHECIVADGDPAEDILRTAESRHAGFIVAGTHGRRGLRRLFLGSVAESIVRQSTVPVAVVRIADARARDALQAAGVRESLP